MHPGECSLAVSRWERGVRLPVPAVLVGVANVALAGVVAMTAGLVRVVAYFMQGP